MLHPNLNSNEMGAWGPAKPTAIKVLVYPDGNMSLVNSAALHCCDFKKGSILGKKKKKGIIYHKAASKREGGRHHPVWEIPQDTDFKDFLVKFTENNKMIGKRDIQAKHSYTDLMLYSLKGQYRMDQFQKQDTEFRP